jgi:SAM-dependent methyltransferase
MSCISDKVKKDIDVLFYGAINERRLNVINELKEKKINIFATNHAYCSVRDSLISRSKIVLNLHYYTPGTLEVARLGYLWANKKSIVSEKNNDTEFYPELENACAFANINDITGKIIELLNNPDKIKKNEIEGFNSYKSIDYPNELKKIFGTRTYSVPPIKSIPKKLNIGSGKEFLSECINIDINEICKPDIVLDISKPITLPLIMNSKRFGDVKFTENQFEYIKAYDVLEHIPDLTQAMTNILKLLKIGGLIDINVPYDLSYGAWQDPTHVRAFNEHSWKYYTQWAWYIGWREHRLDLINIKYVYSDFGKSLLTNTKKENIHTIPRTIDSMIVKFIKRESTIEEIIEHDTIREQHYIERSNNWNISDIINKRR